MRSTLRIVAPAASQDLINLDTLKLELGITDSSSDARLSQIITRASGVVTRISGRVWINEEVEEKFYFNFCECVPALVLRRRPIITINSLTENGSALTEDVDFSIDAERGMLYRINFVHFVNGVPGSPSIVVDYNAGYTIGGSPPGNVPAIVEQATIIMSKAYWFGGSRDPGIKSETTFELDSVTYRDAADAEAAVRNLLGIISDPSWA